MLRGHSIRESFVVVLLIPEVVAVMLFGSQITLKL